MSGIRYLILLFTLLAFPALLAGENELVFNHTTPPPFSTTFNLNDNNVFLEESPNSSIGNHLVFLDAIQLVFRNITVGYEFYHDSDKVSIRIPVSYGFSGNYYEIGSEFKFYLTKPYTFHRNIGPIEAGDANIRYFVGPATSYLSVNKSSYLTTRVTTGLSMQFIKGLNLSLFGSVGPQFLLSGTAQNKVDSYIAINGTVGWRFGGE